MDHAALIQCTACASFSTYVLALVLRSWRPGMAVNAIWTSAFVLMLVHVLVAFHLAHHWSHRSAYEESARQTAEVFGLQWGGGVFANYALLLVWGWEVVGWWRGRLSKGAQAFLAFMWFNGIVVFGHGWVRGVGVTGFLVLAAMMWAARRKRRTVDV